MYRSVTQGLYVVATKTRGGAVGSCELKWWACSHAVAAPNLTSFKIVGSSDFCMRSSEQVEPSSGERKVISKQQRVIRLGRVMIRAVGILHYPINGRLQLGF